MRARALLPIAFTFAAIAAGPSNAATCFHEEQSVTLAGVIDKASGINPVTNDPYRYALLKLDEPICYRGEFGDVDGAHVVALVPEPGGGLQQPLRLVGRRVTISGKLSRSVVETQPPQDLLLFSPTLTR